MAEPTDVEVSDDVIIAVHALDGCFVKLGRRSTERLFLLRHASGRLEIAYPIFGSRRELLVWVTVFEP